MASLLTAGASFSTGAATFVDAQPYLSFADSAFAGVAFDDYFHLEDFEDGLLNTPGVSSASGGFVIGPSAQTDSVDGDDGAIDGSGAGGHSFFSGFPGGTDTFTFDFDAGVLGRLPTHVGIVWTDVGEATPTPGFGSVTFTAFGAGGALGTVVSGTFGDGSTFGATAEDYFFGVIDPLGISRITISMAGFSSDWEVDHLQYGATTVPLPAMFGPCLAGCALLGLRRRRA
ncbi:MAG: hypothetical protein H6977_14140 [Gammaproteobacteria bacterium]|nr:hypothetical protein [Gammaproteobacteria bacterium]